MSKEITCRMIDGKPVVEYKEEYVPKVGDILKLIYSEGETFLVINGIREKYPFGISVSKDNNISFYHNIYLKDIPNSILQATPEECEVMHHILNDNGYDLKGGTVVKKRWMPKMGDSYFYIHGYINGLIVYTDERKEFDDSAYTSCFKTEEAAQSACDKLNELLLSLPQE